MRRLCPAQIVFVVLVFCGSAIAQTDTGSQSPRTQISGRVTDKQGAVLAGVEIEATNSASQAKFVTKSGADGSFSLTVPVGHYAVRYSGKGFKVGQIEVNAFLGGASGINLILPPEQNGELRVHVRDVKGNEAVGIEIRITSANGTDLRGVTDDHGNYVQGALGGGHYSVAAKGGASPCKQVAISSGQSKSVTLKLTERCQ